MADAPRSHAKAHFHLGLLAAFAPGFGALLTVALALVHRRSSDPWARRLALLAGADVLLVLALAALAATGGLDRLQPASAPGTPKVGVQLDAQDARVVSVAPASPAAEADVRKGDRLLRVDGRPVGGAREAADRLRRLEPGRPARIGMDRDGRELEVELVPRPGPWGAAPAEPPDAGPWRPSIGPWDVLPFAMAGALAALTARRGGTSPPAWPSFFLIYLGALVASGATAWGLSRLQGGLSLGATLAALAVQSLAFAAGTRLAQRVSPYEPPAPEAPLPAGRAVLLGSYYLVTLVWRAAVLVTVLLALPIEALPRPEDPIGRLASSGLSPAALALLAVDVVVLAPIAEEMLFRGFLLPRLAARLRPTTALAATAVLFAALHTHYGVQALALVVHGMVLGWARLRTGGLAAPIALHMLVNGVALAVGVLSRS